MVELATIAREFRDRLVEHLGFLRENHAKALDDIEYCQADPTAAVKSYCGKCDETKTMLASCKNRHCPKCQYGDGERWAKRHIQRLLPVSYFMVTFTVPAELRQVMKTNQETAYNILFRAVNKALMEFGSDPKYLGGKCGYTAVLHTWARDLGYHPHIHCIMPGGAFDEQRNRWCRSSKEYLFHVGNLSKRFKKHLYEGLQKEGLIRFLPEDSFKKDIVVDCRPVDKGKQAFEYLGCYIFRTAISNRRILSLENDKVTFEYRDSKTKQLKKRTLPALDFLELYLQHILPDNFMKVRTYGLMHHSNHALLDRIALLLNWRRPDPHLQKGRPAHLCPKCQLKMTVNLHFIRRDGEAACRTIIVGDMESKPP